MRNRRDKYARAGTQSLLPTPITKHSIYNGVQIYHDFLREKFCFFSPTKRRQEVPDTNLGQIYPKIDYMFPNYTKSTLLNGILAYWSFNQTLSDSTPNGFNLTAVNTTYTSGIISSGLNFALGSNGYANNLSISAGQSWSISCWNNISSFIVGTSQAIWGTGAVPNTPQTGDCTLYLNSNLIRVYNGIGGQTDIITTFVPQLNTWNHYVVTASPDAMLLYINNSLAGTMALPADNSFTGLSFCDFLGEGSLGNYPIDGSVDEVGVWNRPLTATEISSLYNSGAAKTYPFS
jgi:uncharacterized protein